MKKTIELTFATYAALLACRRDGEGDEEAIVRRLLQEAGRSAAAASSAHEKLIYRATKTSDPSQVGFLDRRNNVEFPEGFEVFRIYLGKEYRAKASKGAFVRTDTGERFSGLNELSNSVGAKTENAWVNWFYNEPDGQRRAVSALRSPDRIARRKNQVL